MLGLSQAEGLNFSCSRYVKQMDKQRMVLICGVLSLKKKQELAAKLKAQAQLLPEDPEDHSDHKDVFSDDEQPPVIDVRTPTRHMCSQRVGG